MGAVEKPSSHTASRESRSNGARSGGAPEEGPGLIWESLEAALDDLAGGDEAPGPASAPTPTPARPDAIRALREASVLLEALLHKALPVALPVHGPQALPLLIEQAHVSGLGAALGTPARDLEAAVEVRNRVLAHARALREGRLESAPGAEEVDRATARFQATIGSLDAHLVGQSGPKAAATPAPPAAPPTPAEPQPAPAPIAAEPIAATPTAPAAIIFPAQATAELLIVPPPTATMAATAPEAGPARRPRRAPQWLKSLGSMAATLCFCALGVYAGTKWLDPNASLDVLRGRAEALCWEAQAYDPADGFSKAQDRVEALRREAQALYQVGRKDAVRRSYQEIIAHCETLSRLDRERQSARFARQRLQARDPNSPALVEGEEAYKQHLFGRAEQIWTKSVPVTLANETGVDPARDSNAEPVSLTRAEGPAKKAPSAAPAPIGDLEPALPEPAPPAPLPEVPPATEPIPSGTDGASIPPRPLPESIAATEPAPPEPAKAGPLASSVDDARREMESLKGRYEATATGPGADESVLWSRAMDLGRQGTTAEAKGDLDAALVAYRSAAAMLPEAHREAALARAKAAAESDRAVEALDILSGLLTEAGPAGPGGTETTPPGVQPLFDQIAPRGLAWWLARAREQAGAVEDPAARALARVSVASVSREAGDFDEAARAVEAIVDPIAKADACAALALARFRAGSTPEAAATLRRGIAALESAPSARWSHFAELVQAAGTIGDRDLWQATLDASFRARPKHEALAREIPGLTAAQYDQYWKAIYHLMYGEVTAARKIAEALGSQREMAGDPYLLCALARGAAALGDLEDARPLIEQATAKLNASKIGDARRTESLAELALAYALAGRLDEAARWTSRLESPSDCSRVYRVISQQRARRGELAEAETALDEITDPAERALAARSLASARCREGDWLRIARWSDALPATDLRAVALAAVADAVQPRRAAAAQATKADGEQAAAAIR